MLKLVVDVVKNEKINRNQEKKTEPVFSIRSNSLANIEKWQGGDENVNK
jgi:hypothetical protein